MGRILQLSKKSRASDYQQIVAGAMVARQLMRTLDLAEIRICPWALREGIVLHRLDWIER
jgi:exopolyphosphatase/guanosine-5'-triphosphate,3'-diphosphate pyrophosphatase